MKLKPKVILFEILIVLLVSASMGVILTLNMERVLTQKAHQFSERMVRDLSKSIEYNYISYPACEEAVRSFRDTQGIVYLGYEGFIMDGDTFSQRHLSIGTLPHPKIQKKLQAHMQGVTNFETDPTPVEYSKKKLAFQYFMPVTIKLGTRTRQIGHVVLWYSKSIIDREIYTARILILIITLAVTILAGFISVRGSNQIVKPILHLTNQVKRFTDGNYSVRAGNISSKDEIGDLARSMDEMMVSTREKLEMQKYVSNSTIEMIHQSVKTDNSGRALENIRTRVTLLFSDIRGFTSLSETMDPKEVVDMLDLYLETQTLIIRQFGGDIDKFVGDEIVAVFLGDSMEQRSVQAARAIQKKLIVMNKERVKNGGNPVQVGIGIHVGEVIMGSIGSHDRMDYTVIGDNVNLASRLCSAAGRDEVIISGDLYDGLSNQNNLTELDPIKVKGKLHPIRVYRAELG